MNSKRDVPVQDQRRPVGYLQLIRSNVDFRYLWVGQIVSLFGDWFNLIASAALVAQLTQSGLAVGGLFVVRMVAQFVGTQVGGVAADRYNRKLLLISTDLARAVIVFGFLFVRSPDHVWLLYALTILLMAISGVFFPTRSAILPDITTKRELGTANALSSTTWSVTLAIGAALGGFVAGQWGIYQAFAIDALTFLVSAGLIARMRYDAPLTEVAAGLKAVTQDYLNGFRYLRREPDVLFITLHLGAIGLFIAGGIANVAMARVSQTIFVIGEGGGTGLGLLFAIVGLGTGVGPLLSRLLTGDRGPALRRSLAPMYLLGSLGLAVAATLASFEMVMLGMFLRGFAVGGIWVFSTQLLYQLVDDKLLGRVLSMQIAMFTLASAISAAFAGWALDSTALKLDGLFRLMALGGLIPALLWLAWMRLGQPKEAVPTPSPDGDEWRPIE
ncbi:MAG: MFS transporter [Chloroflexi bacterium]|nr:MFS transporter [Chloroflexota bacterium]